MSTEDQRLDFQRDALVAAGCHRTLEDRASMAGVNQCLTMAFGVVAIAGIVGSGGLGTAIYDAVRTLDIGKSIDAGIAIVILATILDRITEGAAKKERGAA